jgi:hypothetical protein
MAFLLPKMESRRSRMAFLLSKMEKILSGMQKTPLLMLIPEVRMILSHLGMRSADRLGLEGPG